MIRKTIKKLLGAGLAIALCVAILPMQTAQAASGWDGKNLGDGEYVDDSDMTGEQLLEAYSGEWGDFISGCTINISEERLAVNGEEIQWSYEGTVVKENVPQSMEELVKKMLIEEGLVEGDISEITDVQALHFSDENNNYYMYKRYSEGDEAIVARLSVYEKTTGDFVDAYYPYIKYVGDNKYTVNECLAMAKETVAEAPKTEEPKTEEPKTDEPTEVPTVEVPKKTESGRDLFEGEEVYIVKKGDCLWSIAKTLLGKGTRYKELFIRNGDIVEKAELIFPGQEIIIPAK